MLALEKTIDTSFGKFQIAFQDGKTGIAFRDVCLACGISDKTGYRLIAPYEGDKPNKPKYSGFLFSKGAVKKWCIDKNDLPHFIFDGSVDINTKLKLIYSLIKEIESFEKLIPNTQEILNKAREFVSVCEEIKMSGNEILNLVYSCLSKDNIASSAEISEKSCQSGCSRMRTIANLAKEIKKIDPNTDINEDRIYRMIKKGGVPYINSGTRILVDFDEFIKCLNGTSLKK